MDWNLRVFCILILCRAMCFNPLERLYYNIPPQRRHAPHPTNKTRKRNVHLAQSTDMPNTFIAAAAALAVGCGAEPVLSAEVVEFELDVSVEFDPAAASWTNAVAWAGVMVVVEARVELDNASEDWTNAVA